MTEEPKPPKLTTEQHRTAFLEAEYLRLTAENAFLRSTLENVFNMKIKAIKHP